MLEKIKIIILNYYLLIPEKNRQDVSFQERELFVKSFLNKIIYVTGFTGIFFIWSTISNYTLLARITFPFFLLSLIPYYLYLVMVKLLSNEKKLSGN